MSRTTRARRKLSMWSALPPYLGGKRRLCPLIFREIDRIVPRRRWPEITFLDAFLGGGSVSLYAKAQGLRVVATDIAGRAIVVGRALIENSRTRLTWEDVVRLAVPADSGPGPVESRYVPSVFNREQGRFLDRALHLASRITDPAKAALYRLLAIRVALLAHPMSQVRKGTAHRASSGEWEAITPSCLYHYVDGLKLTRPPKLWEIAQQINGGIFEGRATVRQANVLDAIGDIKADVAYFDPPYPGVMSYEKEYKVIDQMLENTTHPTSPFTAKDGAAMLDTLFERATHIPVWMLSLGNEVVTIEELEAKMAKHGRKTKATAIAYKHLPAVATEEKKRENREFLVVGWAPGHLCPRDFSMQNAGIESPGVEGELPPASTAAYADTHPPGTEGVATQRIAGNPTQKGELCFIEECASNPWRRTAEEPQVRFDDPHTLLAESGPRGDGERAHRVIAPEGLTILLTSLGVKDNRR